MRRSPPTIKKRSKGRKRAGARPGGTGTRRPRLLWANRYCLLDTSSGASMAVREMLLQLVRRGVEVDVVGATIFDSERGLSLLGPQLEESRNAPGDVVRVQDGPLLHNLVRTASPNVPEMTFAECGKLFTLYNTTLEQFKPDLVWFYGGKFFDFLIPMEAKKRGIPSAALLVNGAYRDTQWCRDVDLIVTDSQATADKYRADLDLAVTPVGAFIDPARVVAASHSRTHVTFVNPSLAKGGVIVAQLALAMESRRPDIRFEVVESRGQWSDVVKLVSRAQGETRSELRNVTVTPTTNDMRTVYRRSRMLLVPSLWWDSGPRVIVEALLNGIPVLVTSRGGCPEMAGQGGIVIELPAAYHEPPYGRTLASEGVEQIVKTIERLFDNEKAYRTLSAKAAETGRTRHNLETSTDRLLDAFRPYLPGV